MAAPMGAAVEGGHPVTTELVRVRFTRRPTWDSPYIAGDEAVMTAKAAAALAKAGAIEQLGSPDPVDPPLTVDPAIEVHGLSEPQARPDLPPRGKFGRR